MSDEEFAELVIERDEFHGEWNYQIMSRLLIPVSCRFQLIGAKEALNNYMDVSGLGEMT